MHNVIVALETWIGFQGHPWVMSSVRLNKLSCGMYAYYRVDIESDGRFYLVDSGFQDGNSHK